MENPIIRSFIETAIYDEIMPSIDMDEAEKRSFADAVVERFENPFVHHELLSISLNSVAKWPVRVLPSLKAYLTRSVINRSHDLWRANRKKTVSLDAAEQLQSAAPAPDQRIIFSEQPARLNAALATLPDDQRQVVVLRHKADMKFRQIAKLQDISVSTVQGRYRYGIDKLRSILNGELRK